MRLEGADERTDFLGRTESGSFRRYVHVEEMIGDKLGNLGVARSGSLVWRIGTLDASAKAVALSAGEHTGIVPVGVVRAGMSGRERRRQLAMRQSLRRWSSASLMVVVHWSDVYARIAVLDSVASPVYSWRSR